MGLRIPGDDVVDQPMRPFRRKGCQCLDECGIVGLPVRPGCHRPAREGVDLAEIAEGRQVPQERGRGPVGAGLATAPFRVGPVDPNPFGEEMRLIPERRLRIGTGLLPCPDQLAEKGNAHLQPALAEDRGAMPARPDDEGGALVEPIEAGAFVAGSLLKLELIRLQVVEHAGRGELIQLEGKRSQVRMAAVGMTPSVDELTALVDFADLELIVVVTAPIAAAGVLRPAGFLDRDQCEVEVAIGLARSADQETRSGCIGALEPVEPDFGRGVGVLQRIDEFREGRLARRRRPPRLQQLDCPDMLAIIVRRPERLIVMGADQVVDQRQSIPRDDGQHLM
jgi:hypothetical protein